MAMLDYLPEWLVSEEQIKRNDAILEEIYSDPSIIESARQLESTILNEKYKYYSQIETINNCLQESFWENSELIKINNYFLAFLEDLMDASHNLQKKDNKKNRLRFEWAKSSLRSSISECGISFFKKLEKNNPDLWFQDLIKLSSKYDDKFIDLILERIKYIPDDENRTK